MNAKMDEQRLKSAYEAANENMPVLKPPLQQLLEEHSPLRMQMDDIYRRADEIGKVEGANEAEQFAELMLIVEAFDSHLLRHSGKEEDLLFPMMARYIGRDTGPIAVMEFEHDLAKQHLRTFFERSRGLSDEADVSEIREAAGFAAEAVVILMEHFCKEEHALFPMANTMLTEEEIKLLTDEFERIDAEGGNGMNKVIGSEQRVGDIVSIYTQASNVFKAYGIDFCCGGQQTVAEAAKKKQLPEEELLTKLNEVCTAIRPAWPLDWQQDERKLAKLVAHITATHHQFLREELPVLRDFVNKVARVHGEEHRELLQLQQLYRELADELLEHLNKEEQQLFPAIIRAEAEGSDEAFTQARALLDTLEAEHEGAGELLQRMREVTEDYILPEGACRTYSLTFRKLEELEADMFTHIHLENSLLFPALEQR
ncbi:iron-sulfur cluster repair di-iron protein [Paenibacillus phyllosphaerae]|uniref:Iron-sulfur cluster repair di-iron protein n=1 Tax=Paenibacillus phyllosphaerae TaxID=274593 RepID=A0A7W5AY76_9BACL|nr:iron-sulfur cluster repair di-iron protein [Paenibacillus phyllosphaerae]MBB3110945.1 iron-sulfur cluster repair di-iron protein [Paenibacillus phyllosphaerae]